MILAVAAVALAAFNDPFASAQLLLKGCDLLLEVVLLRGENTLLVRIPIVDAGDLPLQGRNLLSQPVDGLRRGRKGNAVLRANVNGTNWRRALWRPGRFSALVDFG
jgi:hypothetical protein